MLTKLFSRDLAYGKRVMDPDVARRYASGLIAECAAPGAKIFTNARWNNDSLDKWTSITNATFNVLILIVSSDLAVSVLVEDED